MFGIASSSLMPRDFYAMQSSFGDTYPDKVQDVMLTLKFAAGTSFELGRALDRVSNADVSVWVDGEAYNLAELKEEFPFIDGESFSGTIIQAYREGVLEPFLSRIDGYFCAVLYDRDMEQVKLISDRYGMRMLYWYCDGSKFLWSANILNILAVEGVDADIHKDSVECFKDLGYVLEDNTFFKHVKLIQPATVMTFDIAVNHYHSTRYWSWSKISKQKITFDDAVNRLGELFLSAVQRRFNANEKIGVAVSGGLDSRAIVAAIAKLDPNQKYMGYTFGVEGCDDINFAKQVLTKAGWQHETYLFTQDNWLGSRLPYIDVTSGLLDMQHMHGCEFLPEISKMIDVNMNGYAGDAILGGGFLTKIPWDTRASLTNIQPFFGKFSYMVNVEDEFYDIECVEPVLYMNRVRRFTAMGSVCGLHYLEQRKPFFDNQLVEFVFSIPDSFRANNRIYSEMLKRFFPDYFMDIPWQKTGKIVGLLMPKPLHMKIYHRIIKLVLGPNSIRQKGREFTDYPHWLRCEPSKTYFTQLFSQESSVLWQRFGDDVLSLLNSHLTHEQCDNSSVILRLATLELFLSKALKLND